VSRPVQTTIAAMTPEPGVVLLEAHAVTRSDRREMLHRSAATHRT
jgi:hypothetical protein